jgi:hypothetical protein
MKVSDLKDSDVQRRNQSQQLKSRRQPLKSHAISEPALNGGHREMKDSAYLKPQNL